MTVSLGWTAGWAPISWRNFCIASSQSASSSQTGMGTTILGSSWATSAAAVVAESAPPMGTHTMSTGPMSPSFSSVSSWPMSPRWMVWRPSSSVTNAVCLPRLAPRPASRYVRTPVTSASCTSYSPGPSSTNAGSRLVGMAVPPSRDVLFGFLGPRPASSGWLKVMTSPVIPRPVGPTIDG